MIDYDYKKLEVVVKQQLQKQLLDKIENGN